MCEFCEEHKQELTEEEIEDIIVERYNDKDDKTKNFIRKALRVHGDKFDYYDTEYKKAKDRVIITCRKHGNFSQTPDNHLQEKGCKDCSYEHASIIQRDTVEEFIEKAKVVHKDKYDYSKVVYINNHTEVIITCPIHGDFPQTPSNHLQGKGCSKCSGNCKSNTEEFIEKVKEVHGNKYNYDKVDYISADDIIIITCPIHGDFPQTPNNHLQGKGCKKCGIDIKTSLFQKPVDQFINEAKLVHNNKYDYSKVVYINNHTEVIITCPIHGDFPQTPYHHLRGEGCPDCHSSIGETIVKILLDELNIKYNQKIAVRNKNNCIMYPDFVLLETSIWIEYNGVQHYEFDRFFHDSGISDFIYQLERDIRKRVYCKENNITLIEIPYTLKTRDSISDFLDKVLIQHIDPNTLVNYSELYKLDNTGLNLEDLFPT